MISKEWSKYPPEIAQERQEYMKKAGKVIRKARQEANLTQKKLADLIALSTSLISGYEAGKTDMPYSNLPLILYKCKANIYESIRHLLPNENAEFRLVLDRLLDILIDRGIDVSIFNSIYPKFPAYCTSYVTLKDVQMSRDNISYREVDSTEQIVMHDEPTIAVHDTLSLLQLSLAADACSDSEIENAINTILKCLLFYWISAANQKIDSLPELIEKLKEENDD